MSCAAVEMAERLGSLGAAKVVVVGAGDVGDTAVALSARGVGQLVVVNRTETRVARWPSALVAGAPRQPG